MAASKQRVLNPDLDEAPPRPPSGANPGLAIAISAFAVLVLAAMVWLNFGGSTNAPAVAPEAKSFKVRGEGPEAADPPPPVDRAVYDVIEGQATIARPLPPEALAKAEAAGALAAEPSLAAAPDQAPPAGPIDLRKPANSAPAAKPEPVKPDPARPAASDPPVSAKSGPAKSGPVVVQIAALRSPDAARALFVRVQEKVPAAAGAILIVQPVSQPNGQVFRVRIGHFADRAGADTFCASLRAQSFDCQVIAP
jgi:cell division septation protein DedD